MDVFTNSLIERLLSASVHTALLGTVVWLLCRFLPRLSPSSQCWLWWLVTLQALLGLIVSPIEFPWLPSTPASVSGALAGFQWNAIPDIAATASLAVPERFSWQTVAFPLWIAGVLIMSLYTMRDWLRGKSLRTNSAPCEDQRLLQALAHAACNCGMRTPPPLRLSTEIDSPVLIGHRQPVLLLPDSTSMSNEELDMAFTHELSHVRRGDLWLGCIPALARHVYFFHPFAHLAVREYGIAREAACDAKVVNSGHRCRQGYGRLLVRIGASPESRTGLAVSSPTFQSLQRRLSALQKTSFLSSTVSIVLLGIVAATGVLPLRLVAGAAPDAVTGVRTSQAATTSDMTHLRESEQKKENAERAQSTSLASAPAPKSNQRNATGAAQNFLDSQIAIYKERMQEVEARLAEFKKRNASAGTDKEPEVEAEYTRLIRDSELSRRMYENLVIRRGRIEAVDEATPILQGNQRQATSAALDLRDAQISLLEQRLQEAEARLAEFKKRNVGAGAVKELGLEQEFGSLERQYDLARRQYMELVFRSSQTQLAAQASAPNDIPATEPAAQAVPENYLIARGDALQIWVWKYSELEVTVPVRPDGRISTPLVEDLTAEGKTPSQLARDIESALARFIRAPKVTVIVKESNVR